MRTITELFELLRNQWPAHAMVCQTSHGSLEAWDAGSVALQPLITLEFSDEEWESLDCLNRL
jgi:hypothetical protein